MEDDKGQFISGQGRIVTGIAFIQDNELRF